MVPNFTVDQTAAAERLLIFNFSVTVIFCNLTSYLVDLLTGQNVFFSHSFFKFKSVYDGLQPIDIQFDTQQIK